MAQQSNHPQADEQKLKANMSAIANKILVLSGKGGVGKSTVAANIAVELAREGFKTGLLDIDLHGPSIPVMTGLSGQRCLNDGGSIVPIDLTENLKVMSVAFLLSGDEQAVIWRGPMKYAVIKQLLADTKWGDLDYLIIDAPPGTGDEPLSAAQLVGENSTAIIVTTPQRVAIADVQRCITFCNQLELKILGIIENMSGLYCPDCKHYISLFGKDGGKYLAEKCGLELLGQIPIDSQIGVSADNGKVILDSMASGEVKNAISEIINKILSKR